MSSDSDASAHSSASSRSPSPSQQSPEASIHAEPSLQRLTSHFVNAKRSLSTTHQVFRANELVTSSRGLVEEIAGLNARNEYAGRAAGDGLQVLEDVRWEMERKGEDAGTDFQQVVKGMDEANRRLEATLEKLGVTVVDASLQRWQDRMENSREDTVEKDGGSDEEQATQAGEKTLLSFIDTSKHESLVASLKAQIADFYAAGEDLSSSLDAFRSSTNTFHAMLSPPAPSPEPPELLRPALFDEPPPTISQLFHTITDNASTMASLLQSLVSHYDLCVTALRHTEGGGEAAKKAVQQQKTSPNESGALLRSRENMEDSLYRKPHALPIDTDERREMLAVLEHDSAELPHVISDLNDHASDLECAFDKLATHARRARTRDATLREIVTMLREMHSIHLPSHLHRLRTFEQDWSRIRAGIVSSTAQLSDLSDFYAEFLAGYGKLLKEMERRKQAEREMRRIAEKAGREIGRVWERDQEARGEFMRTVGGVLPGDLWPALGEEARRWGVVEVGLGKVESEAPTEE